MEGSDDIAYLCPFILFILNRPMEYKGNAINSNCAIHIRTQYKKNSFSCISNITLNTVNATINIFEEM